MVNGNYVLYGDRPSSESEIVVDHVHRSIERKIKRKANRTANELQHSLNMAQLDNETDSVKYEKKIKEPRLLRYVPTSDVEENFVSEKFETYDLKPTEERPRRYVFTKKPKNPSDGSVNYAYSRSSSSSPNGNLPTISEHGEQYGTYRVRPAPTTPDIMNGYESKLEKYFTKPKELKKFSKGSHPDSLYRVPTSSGAGAGKMARVLRVLRWPAALFIVCVALAVFVYFLMPDNLTPDLEIVNSTYWETNIAGAGASLHKAGRKTPETNKKDTNSKHPHKHGSKTPEIDFYGADSDKKYDLISFTDTIEEEKKPKKKLPIAPVFPEHIAPEVQYGNEKSDTEKLRSGKKFDELNRVAADSTVKPHITQKPEKPLAIYFKDAVTAPVNKAETVNDFLFDEKQTTKTIEEELWRNPTKAKVSVKHLGAEPVLPPEVQEYYNRQPANFTSGHSKLFGIGIEDAEKMQSTTQSSLYNTRVSPTLPTWRDGDDTTTKKYPVNANYDVPQCRSPHLALCRGVLPYDLAGASAIIGGTDITSLLPQIEYLMATNCSERIRHFACALLEPECNPPPYPPKMPCHSLCKAVRDSCVQFVPRQLIPAFNCKQFSSRNCVVARTPCYEREVSCGDGTCIPRDWMCDGTQDCPNGEDEESCIHCTKDEFQCPNGGCILKRWVCDGYKDCPKGEDEDVSRCENSGLWPRVDTRGDPFRGEPGEEPAGSAPAPSIRRPNRLPDIRTGENDSSKELLITSDSSNALKRNFTRRPSSSRLTPYRPKLRTITTTVDYQSEEEEHTQKPFTIRRFQTKMTTTTVKLVEPQQTSNRESTEDVNIGDLGFFEELEDTKSFKAPETKSGGQRPKQEPRAPLPVIPEAERQLTHIDKSSNRFERVFDGAAMLRKAAAAETEEAAMKNSTAVDKDDFPTDRGPGVVSSHSSPCPSGELRCVDGRCITLAQLCDGIIDCSDHADEDNCYT